MGFMDELKKLTQPYEDDDDFFEGADIRFKPKAKPQEERPQAAATQRSFEDSFGADTRAPEAETEEEEDEAPGSIFGSFGGFGKRGASGGARAPKFSGRERTMNFGGRDGKVMLFSPKNVDEAGELANYLRSNLTVVLTLESVDNDTGRRLLDFMSGIAFAMSGKITPVSAKTFFVTPQNVDILGAAQDQPESSGQYF